MIFFGRGAWCHVCNTCACTQKISYFHAFLEKGHPSLPAQGKNMFLGKNTIFPDNTRKIMSRRGPSWKDHLFRTFEENIIFPCIFWERSSFIFRLRCKIIFSGKRNMIFPDNTRKIPALFLEETTFSGRREKENMWRLNLALEEYCRNDNILLNVLLGNFYLSNVIQIFYCRVYYIGHCSRFFHL